MKLNFQKNTLIVAILLIISLALTGCSGNEQEKARSELAKLNIEYTPESFLNCIQNNDTVVFKLFMQVGMDANAKNQEGITALMLAAKIGNMEMVNSLLSKGAQVNSKTAKGNTALEYAALEDRLDVVKTLLDKSADINNKNDLGMTPLMCAVDKGHAAVVKELIAKGADINTVPAHLVAKSKDNKEMLDTLIKAGVKEPQPPNLVGEWKDSKYPESIILDIKEHAGNQISGVMFCLRNNGAQIAKARFSGTLNNNTLTCSYNEDGWGNSGEINIKVEAEQIVVTVTQLKKDKSGGLWALMPGTYYMCRD